MIRAFTEIRDSVFISAILCHTIVIESEAAHLK